MTRLPQTSHSSLGWHSRGYLPHFDGGALAQFITFRLHDALPQSAIVRWRDELRSEQPGFAESIMRRRVEAYLDQGHGTCYLKDPSLATIVQDALLFHDGAKYRLAAWTIMPNHVHVLCTPCAGHSLAEIMHSVKSYTSNQANKVRSRTGRFWQKEYFDRYIRNLRHYSKVLAYIENNPVKARLCEEPGDWSFGSIGYRKT